MFSWFGKVASGVCGNAMAIHLDCKSAARADRAGRERRRARSARSGAASIHEQLSSAPFRSACMTWDNCAVNSINESHREGMYTEKSPPYQATTTFTYKSKGQVNDCPRSNARADHHKSTTYLSGGVNAVKDAGTVKGDVLPRDQLDRLLRDDPAQQRSNLRQVARSRTAPVPPQKQGQKKLHIPERSTARASQSRLTPP